MFKIIKYLKLDNIVFLNYLLLQQQNNFTQRWNVNYYNSLIYNQIKTIGTDLEKNFSKPLNTNFI